MTPFTPPPAVLPLVGFPPVVLASSRDLSHLGAQQAGGVRYSHCGDEGCLVVECGCLAMDVVQNFLAESVQPGS